jgi:AcrR family transcriptional regulator
MRDAILVAAAGILAQDGKEGVSLARAAANAGVSRSAAQSYFATREELVDAAAAWAGEQLYNAVFGDAANKHRTLAAMRIEEVAEQLARFSMEHPELMRAWLYRVLSSKDPAADDKFFRSYKTLVDRFVQSDVAQPGIDSEVHSVLMLAGTFLWPVYVQAGSRSPDERRRMTDRFTREIARLTSHGVLQSAKPPKSSVKLRKIKKPI